MAVLHWNTEYRILRYVLQVDLRWDLISIFITTFIGQPFLKYNAYS